MQPKEIRIYAKTPAGFGYTRNGDVLTFMVRPLGDLDWPGGDAPASGFITLRGQGQYYAYQVDPDPPPSGPLSAWWFWTGLTAAFLLVAFLSYFAGATAGRPVTPAPGSPVKLTECEGLALYRYTDGYKHVYFTVPDGKVVHP